MYIHHMFSFIFDCSVLRYEAHRFHDGYLQISIKDRGFLGQGIFLGEAFLPLNELKVGDMDQRLHDLPQIQLPLSKPSGFGKFYVFILECRGNLIPFWKVFILKPKVQMANTD